MKDCALQCDLPPKTRSHLLFQLSPVFQAPVLEILGLQTLYIMRMYAWCLQALSNVRAVPKPLALLTFCGLAGSKCAIFGMLAWVSAEQLDSM